MTRLRALGWDHPRCMGPMRACAAAWRELHPDVAIDWEVRSLGAFGDQPLEEVAGSYDLLVIDHPFCGTAEAAACLTPLDELLEPTQLRTLEADAVGPSHTSYSFHGRQWGLATDAACQVSAVREDLLGGPPPRTWDEVLELARDLPGRTAIPLAPAHAISSYLTLCANAGGSFLDPEVGTASLALLRELYRLGPAEAIDWEPPDVLAWLASDDELVYVPLTYGYVSYSPPCRFLDIPSAGSGPVGSVLGGAGLAVSAASAQTGAAAAFAGWASGAEAQRELVGPAGGQPGSRTAWADPELDRAAGGFFSGTLATIEAAWVRPRETWWPAFQLEGGRLLSRALAGGGTPSTIRDELAALYGECSGERP